MNRTQARDLDAYITGSAGPWSGHPHDPRAPDYDDEPLTLEVALEDATDEFQRDGFALAQGLACMVGDGEKLHTYATSFNARNVDPSELSAGQLLAFVLAPVEHTLRSLCATELRERLTKAAKDQIKARAEKMIAEAA